MDFATFILAVCIGFCGGVWYAIYCQERNPRR